MGGSGMGISKNVFLRKGVANTLYFNQEGNHAINSTWPSDLGPLNAIAFSFFAKLTERSATQAFIGGLYTRFYVATTKKYSFRYYDGTISVLVNTNINAIFGRWIHVVFVKDFANKRAKIIIDNETVYSNDFILMEYKLDAYLCIGNLKAGGTGYIDDGNMAFLKIYNRVPSDNEIKLLSKNYPISRVGLIGEWDLTEGAGSVSFDKSGRGKDLTISGGAWNNDKPF